MEKQRDKAAKRMQRKAEKLAGHVEPDMDAPADAEAEAESESPESIEATDSTTV